jgi:diguanylate cyclase (GGDEF)-like protein
MDGNGREESVAELATRLGLPDALVFRRVTRTSWAHLGGIGRGRGWAGIVQVDSDCDPLVDLVPDLPGQLIRVHNPHAARVLGPYYCVGGAVVRVSEDVLVVLGNPQRELPESCTDQDLHELAALLEATVEEAGPAKRLADELELLHAVRAVISLPAEKADEALSHVLKVALDALSCEVGVIRDDRGRWARSPGLSGPDISSFQLKGTLDRLQEKCGSGSICFQDTSLSQTELAPLGYQDGVRSLLAVAIPRPVGGVLVVGHTLAAPRGFTALCVELGKHIAEAAAVVAHTAALREELKAAAEQHASLARMDPLTGLGNRLAWDEALVRAQEQVDNGGCVTVITLDIDGLKQVNDTAGHAAGDALLSRCAQIIRENVRGDDVCARLGGDEFAVLIPHPEELAEHLLVALRDRLNGAASNVETAAASIGMATAPPGGRVADAVREADLAMYAVKRGRRAQPAPVLAPTPAPLLPTQARPYRRRELAPPGAP